MAGLEDVIRSKKIEVIFFGEAERRLLELGKNIPVNAYDEQINSISLTDVATIVYTSGTTGLPKGVVLTHQNIMGEVQSLQQVFDLPSDHIALTALPLAHILARGLQFYLLAQGVQTAFAENLESLAKNFLEIRPHFFVGVPRIFEKVYERTMAQVDRSPRSIKNFLVESLTVACRLVENPKKGTISWKERLQVLMAQSLVFRRLKKRMGGRMRYLISGGAPLQKKYAEFFHAAGILLLEGYGLTETTAAITVNRPDDFSVGTVGRPLPSARIRIAGDGEICVKGPMVFREYWNLKEETKKSFDSEGWFLTGDLGEFTKEGFLRVVDRKKEIIVTSGGKNIAPQRIEAILRKSPYIDQVMVCGEGRRFLSALITLNWEKIEAFASASGMSTENHRSLIKDPFIVELIETELRKQNENLAPFETVKKFILLEEDFSIENGALTPTLKIKRKMVAEKYQNMIESLYQGTE